MSGPLSGLRVVELAAIGPVPFCGMLLADMGADVIRVDKVASSDGADAALTTVCGRGKRSIALDLKTDAGVAVLHDLAANCDVLLEGFRPGVAERLGIGPADLARANPSIVYGRMTGWGQSGPLAPTAGHDINYIALTGALHAIGSDSPVVPLNLIGDYGGGALYLAVGVLAALQERATSGRGQVVDAAMIDGVASLLTPTFQLAAGGHWRDERGANLLDGGAPFYAVYPTADDKHVAVGALEPQFYSELLAGLGLEADAMPDRLDRNAWPQLRAELAAVFRTASRDHWENVFAGTDACVTPVLSLEEAPRHVHNRARETFLNITAEAEPAPAPRFSRTPAGGSGAVPFTGRDTAAILAELGRLPGEVDELVETRVVAMGTA